MSLTRRFAFISRPVALLSAAVVAVGACRNGTDPDTLRPGDPSLAIEVFGGGMTLVRRTTVVDSAAERWQKIKCDPAISVSPCFSGTLLAAGGVTREASGALFTSVRAPGFLALPSVIPGGSGPEADGVHYTLVITIGKSHRVVQWNSGATIPASLESVLTNLSAATSNGWQNDAEFR